METIIPISIYILTPIIGLVLFFYTNKNLKPNEKKELYTLKLLIAFGNIGGLTILLLTTLFWKWSGLASLGTAFLIFIAPILMAIIAYDSFKKRKNQAEDKLFKLSISYFVFLPLIFLIAIILDK